MTPVEQLDYCRRIEPTAGGRGSARSRWWRQRWRGNIAAASKMIKARGMLKMVDFFYLGGGSILRASVAQTSQA
jgi:hypothetical protein